MPRYTIDLKTLLDIPLWQKVQDQLAMLTGTAMITVDLKGIPVTGHSCCTEFCSMIRANPIARKRCQRCDALAGLEAVRAGKPYAYLCHCGIADVSVPIVVGEQYLGAVIIGQVRIPNNDSDSQIERLIHEISSLQTVKEENRMKLRELYGQLPEMEYKKLMRIADCVSVIIESIVERTVKGQTNQLQNWLLKRDMDPSQLTSETGQSSPMKTLSLPQEPFRIKKDSPLYPAVFYIGNNPTENITMKQMAALCHLSESYFSRLFTKEMGENFSSYLSRMRVRQSKEMLRDSSMTVTQIAKQVGYQDSSHYIRLFKRFEGITPSVYRQYYTK